MTHSLLLLCLPMTVSVFIFLKEYGPNGLFFFTGRRAIKIVGIVCFFVHLYLLLSKGESWFCGTCFSKEKAGAFLLPSIGYALFTFAPAFAGNTFDTEEEKTLERRLSLAAIGIIFLSGITFLFQHLF